MKNIQVVDGAVDCVYDIFAATEEEFGLIFPPRQDVAFIDEVYQRFDEEKLGRALQAIWARRIEKSTVQGIHGLLFYQFEEKKPFYPTRRDEEAVNPDGSLLRRGCL